MNKPNSIILHWVIFLLKDWIRKIKKKGFFKRLENVKDKNEELLNAFNGAIIVSKDAKNESDFNYDFRYAFYRFDRDF